MTSIFGMLGVDLTAPDHTTLSRRGQHLALALRRARPGTSRHLIGDSTGLTLPGFCGHRRRRENAPGGVHGHTEATTVHRGVQAGAVRLCLRHDRSIGQVARELDLTESAVRNWVKQYEVDHGSNPSGALTTEEKTELRTLRREVRVLREEREILKKAAAFFAKENA